jgi:hypothetical protein
VLLGWRKRRAGAALPSPLVTADAAETILCATLAGTTLLGLVLFAAFGWWWADPAAALAVAWFAVREGREAWHGELACDDQLTSRYLFKLPRRQRPATAGRRTRCCWLYSLLAIGRLP